MATRRFRVLPGIILAACIGGLPFVLDAQAPATATKAARLTDQEFWKLVGDLSETNGNFRSDNLLSNESRLQYVVPDLLRMKPGGAYVGVGPEQNFTLIAALKPSTAFIIDIRRGNLQLHLLYKAVFELSADRIDFVSRLFSRTRPAGLSSRSTAAEIFSAYLTAEPNEALYNQNLKAVQNHLVTKHGFALSSEDLKGIEYVSNAFFTYGPGIQYSSSDGFAGGSAEPTYVELMLATDSMGRQRGFLTSEEAFAYVKDMETRNEVVPVVGDFAGPKAIRGVATYLKERSVTVSAFYVSNVEQYLRLFRNWQVFCANAATLPMDTASMFIRAGRGGRVARGNTMTAELAPMTAEVQFCTNNRF